MTKKTLIFLATLIYGVLTKTDGFCDEVNKSEKTNWRLKSLVKPLCRGLDILLSNINTPLISIPFASFVNATELFENRNDRSIVSFQQQKKHMKGRTREWPMCDDDICIYFTTLEDKKAKLDVDHLVNTTLSSPLIVGDVGKRSEFDNAILLGDSSSCGSGSFYSVSDDGEENKLYSELGNQHLQPLRDRFSDLDSNDCKFESASSFYFDEQDLQSSKHHQKSLSFSKDESNFYNGEGGLVKRIIDGAQVLEYIDGVDMNYDEGNFSMRVHRDLTKDIGEQTFKPNDLNEESSLSNSDLSNEGIDGDNDQAMAPLVDKDMDGTSDTYYDFDDEVDEGLGLF